MPADEIYHKSLTVYPALSRWQRPLKIVNSALSATLGFRPYRQQPATSLRAKDGISGFTLNSDMHRPSTVSSLRYEPAAGLCNQAPSPLTGYGA